MNTTANGSMFSSLSPRELAGAVTPLFVLNGRHQKGALDELVARCERYEAALRRIATIPPNVDSLPSATAIADKALDD